MRIASLSDKLGSLILQMPVTCLMSEYRGTGNADGGIVCDVNWHPDVPARPLIVTAECWHDGRLSHVSSQLVGGESVVLPTENAPGGVKAVIRDPENNVVLGAMNVYITRSVHARGHVQHQRKRSFMLKPRGAGDDREESVGVSTMTQIVAGDPNSLAHFNDTRKRLYREEMAVLRELREFVQYRSDDKDENGRGLTLEERHLRALKDIRYLIEHHGQTAVWLWDPFLDGRDVLDTLFYNSHGGSEMRAISDGERVESPTLVQNKVKSGCLANILGGVVRQFLPESKHTAKPSKKEQFVASEGDVLNQCAGNREGLRLELRARVGTAGFAFHDRFLIFPHAEPEPLAWSLGYSVNAVGKEHHILQKVPNGRLIADAFQDLWDDLSQPEHLIWKTP